MSTPLTTLTNNIAPVVLVARVASTPTQLSLFAPAPLITLF